MKVFKLDVGPLVGATTPDSIRISGRVCPSNDPITPNTYLVARYRKIKSNAPFQMVCNITAIDPTLDHMGVIDIKGLLANTVYEYQLGYIQAGKSPTSTSSLIWDWPPVDNLAPPSTQSFKIFTDDENRSVSFIVGSCRNIRYDKSKQEWLGDKDDEDGDRTFGRILERFPPHTQPNNGANKHPIDFLMMTGDQIYADTLPERKYKFAKTFEEITKRYRKAFTTKNAALLLASNPTYMTWDDHEVCNDWPPVPENSEADDSTFKKSQLYKDASKAYSAYQVLQSPVNPSIPDRYWYDFKVGCADIFVMDVRSERRCKKEKVLFGKKFKRTEMLSNDQVDALKAWLNPSDDSKRVKLIISAVPFFPDGTLPYILHPFKLGGKDTWRSYPAQREDILDFIRRNDIKRVAFLSGDVHCSFSAKLSIGKGNPAWIYNIVASAFHWHTLGWNDSSFYDKKYLKNRRGDRSRYYVEKIDKQVVVKDNYTRVVCEPEKLIVEIYESESGELVSQQHLPFLEN